MQSINYWFLFLHLLEQSLQYFMLVWNLLNIYTIWSYLLFFKRSHFSFVHVGGKKAVTLSILIFSDS